MLSMAARAPAAQRAEAQRAEAQRADAHRADAHLADVRRIFFPPVLVKRCWGLLHGGSRPPIRRSMDELPAATDGAMQNLDRLCQRSYRHDFDLAS